jgi:UBA-like domain
MHQDDADIDTPLTAAQVQQLAGLQQSGPQPDAALASQLAEMGFEPDQIDLALRATNNSQEAATRWLLGDRDMAPPAFSSAGTGAVVSGVTCVVCPVCLVSRVHSTLVCMCMCMCVCVCVCVCV